MKWWVDLAAILTFIITAIGAFVGVYGYIRYRCEFHRKSKSLEKYLQDKKAEDKPLNKRGQRSVLQIIRDVGVTQDEIIRISFHNPHVARRVKADEISNLATDLLFEYEEQPKPPTP